MISEIEMSPSLPRMVPDPKQEKREKWCGTEPGGQAQSPALGRLRKEVLKFKAGLVYRMSSRLA